MTDDLLDRLRHAVRTEGGTWTTGRAAHHLGGGVTRKQARDLLNALADEDLLVKHGHDGYAWTRPAPPHRGGPPIGPDAEEEYAREKADYEGER